MYVKVNCQSKVTNKLYICPEQMAFRHKKNRAQPTVRARLSYLLNY